MLFFKLFISFLFVTLFSWSTISFPKLTSQVVDEAGIFTSEQKSQLSSLLKKHETNSSNQIVVVTLKSLNGYDISEYGYQLGREWGIGQKGKNNGILLIIAPNDRKVRIEVGYGLEGALTDANSEMIISNIITPYFKKGDYFTGTVRGIDAITETIKGEYSAKPKSDNADTPFMLIIMPIILLLLVFLPKIKIANSDKTKKLPFVGASIGGSIAGLLSWVMLAMPLASVVIGIVVFLLMLFGDFENLDFNSNRNNSGGFGGFSGSSGGGFSGGGFSGGGGSFGGGGASGSW